MIPRGVNQFLPKRPLAFPFPDKLEPPVKEHLTTKLPEPSAVYWQKVNEYVSVSIMDNKKDF